MAPQTDANADLRFGLISDSIFRIFKHRRAYDGVAGHNRATSGRIRGEQSTASPVFGKLTPQKLEEMKWTDSRAPSGAGRSSPAWPVPLPPNKVRPIAVTSAKRTPVAPEVRTISETLAGFDIVSWTTLTGPAKLPANVVSRLSELSKKALESDDLKAKFLDLGATA